MTPAISYRTAWLISVTLVVGACAQPPSAATVSAPVVVSVDGAATQLAVSRCDHEASCGDVGAGRTYTTIADCAGQIEHSVRQDLAPCSAGVGPRQLETCQRRIRGESCRPLSTLSRMLACRAATLCATPLAPGEDGPSFTSEDVYGMVAPEPSAAPDRLIGSSR